MRQKGFTLIELLVVIAVIGILSTAVLVYLGGTQEKAVVAQSFQFSQSVYHALGSNLVGKWDFDQSATDTSGYGNNGTLHGTAVYSTSTPEYLIGLGSGKYSLSLGGAVDYVSMGNPNILKLTSSFTLEGWMYLKDTNTNALLKKENGTAGDRGWYFQSIGPDNTQLRLLISDNGTDLHYITTLRSLDLNEWYHLVGVYNSSAQTLKIYVNGEEWEGDITGGAIPAIVHDSSRDVTIGGDTGGMYGFIDNVRIYNTSLTALEIRQHYVQEALEYGVALK